MQVSEVKNYENHGDRSSSRNSDFSLFIVFLTSSQDKEIKLGEGLPSHMIRETLVLSVTGIQQQYDMEVNPILHECCL